MGFGAGGHVASDRIELVSFDLQLVIECVETQEHIEAILPEIDAMMDAGLITIERAKVILYRPPLGSDQQPAERPDEHRIDLTGDWRE